MQEKVYFPNSRGNKLCGILSNIDSDNNNIPIIILCHGFTTSKDGFANTKLEKIFGEHNISTFRFDFFGHGESEGAFEDITISEGVDDILNAVEYVKEKGFTKIGLFGSSFGGICSIIAASKISDLFILVLKSPVSNYLEVESMRRTKEEFGEWSRKGFVIHTNSAGVVKGKLNYSFFDDFKNNDAYAAATKILIPTLIVHGSNDGIVPIAQSEKISKIIKNCRLKIINGADHNYSKSEDFEEMLDKISEFVIRHARN